MAAKFALLTLLLPVVLGQQAHPVNHEKIFSQIQKLQALRQDAGALNYEQAFDAAEKIASRGYARGSYGGPYSSKQLALIATINQIMGAVMSPCDSNMDYNPRAGVCIQCSAENDIQTLKNAQILCNHRSGWLAEPKTEFDLNFIKSRCMTGASGYIFDPYYQEGQNVGEILPFGRWIGIVAPEFWRKDSTWRYAKGSAIPEILFDEAQFPTKYQDRPFPNTCGLISGEESQLDLQNCTIKFPYVCEFNRYDTIVGKNPFTGEGFVDANVLVTSIVGSLLGTGSTGYSGGVSGGSAVLGASQSSTSGVFGGSQSGGLNFASANFGANQQQQGFDFGTQSTSQPLDFGSTNYEGLDFGLGSQNYEQGNQGYPYDQGNQEYMGAQGLDLGFGDQYQPLPYQRIIH